MTKILLFFTVMLFSGITLLFGQKTDLAYTTGNAPKKLISVTVYNKSLKGLKLFRSEQEYQTYNTKKHTYQTKKGFGVGFEGTNYSMAPLNKISGQYFEQVTDAHKLWKKQKNKQIIGLSSSGAMFILGSIIFINTVDNPNISNPQKIAIIVPIPIIFFGGFFFNSHAKRTILNQAIPLFNQGISKESPKHY